MSGKRSPFGYNLMMKKKKKKKKKRVMFFNKKKIELGGLFVHLMFKIRKD